MRLARHSCRCSGSWHHVRLRWAVWRDPATSARARAREVGGQYCAVQRTGPRVNFCRGGVSPVDVSSCSVFHDGGAMPQTGTNIEYRMAICMRGYVRELKSPCDVLFSVECDDDTREGGRASPNIVGCLDVSDPRCELRSRQDRASNIYVNEEST
ncbi:hypothetical protein L227DRAFT_275095 [Lentinus tigrinus ALCF2SS1-6]|uniref:Uncharacterized protein n=1 Tax=Lentinus tigrinus ALCF2SS1-6 TaxID=1328759 RepID=A0A5C2SN07_9APHY|nr:hypothetical protein L227DRAFT_275095 [Lentinus tigrinus ALCF2SS1-6]